MAAVSLREVSKTFPPDVAAVQAVSLDIADGSFVVLVGPSGCGKTTTLRLIAGLEEPSGGTICIGGRMVNHVPPRDRDVAMVFQDYALYPHMTVYKNMAFGLKMRRVPRADIDRRVRQTAATLGITELLGRRPGALSGGQRQRVALGRAIVREPNVFLFDEPLSNLDARLRLSTRAELKTLHQRLKTTAVYVTHDQEEAMSLGEVIVVMCNGRVQQVGAPLEVYRAPANRFVASFMGSPPMNFLEGMLVAEAGGLMFVEGSNDPAGRPYRVPLAASTNGARLAFQVGKPVVLGIRPQAFEPIVNGVRNHATVFEMPVRVYEPLGEQMDVFCGTPKHPSIVARIAAPDVNPGPIVRFAIDPARVHVFEPGEFGDNLTS